MNILCYIILLVLLVNKTTQQNDSQCLTNINQTTVDWFDHFNGIFQRFVTGGSHSISGPLAVKDLWIAPDYGVNIEHTVDCNNQSLSALDKTGLLVESIAEVVVDITVNGNIYVPPYSILSVTQDSQGCTSSTSGQYPLSFSTILSTLDSIELDLLSLPTTLRIDENGVVTKVANRTNPNYDKIQFGTCLYQSCTKYNATHSDDGILFNQTGWSGPVNSSYPTDSIVVFSIPVWENYMIYLTPGELTQGLSPCRIIYHFYPVTGNLNDPTTSTFTIGEFTIVRDTPYIIAGLIMAPQAAIHDGGRGNFAGQVVGRTYQWISPVAGTNILDFNDVGYDCESNFFCPSDNITTVTSTIEIIETTKVTELSTQSIENTIFFIDVDVITTTTSTPTFLALPTTTVATVTEVTIQPKYIDTFTTTVDEFTTETSIDTEVLTKFVRQFVPIFETETETLIVIHDLTEHEIETDVNSDLLDYEVLTLTVTPFVYLTVDVTDVSSNSLSTSSIISLSSSSNSVTFSTISSSTASPSSSVTLPTASDSSTSDVSSPTSNTFSTITSVVTDTSITFSTITGRTGTATFSTITDDSSSTSSGASSRTSSNSVSVSVSVTSDTSGTDSSDTSNQSSSTENPRSSTTSSTSSTTNEINTTYHHHHYHEGINVCIEDIHGEHVQFGFEYGHDIENCQNPAHFLIENCRDPNYSDIEEEKVFNYPSHHYHHDKAKYDEDDDEDEEDDDDEYDDEEDDEEDDDDHDEETCQDPAHSHHH